MVSCTACCSYFDLLHQLIHFLLLILRHLLDHSLSCLSLLPLLFCLVGLVDTISGYDGAANFRSLDGLIWCLFCEL